ncbi:MAG: radical SAM family heme chaperone HemW [Desulfuromonadales bacterium]|nr:radical SAM family heme chaperone HemW [Desulfuromonadales bacterium]
MSSLYLHIPFCSSKCPYCDFFSQVGSQKQLDEYVELLNLNIRILQQKFPHNPPLETIFFGGGTPSLLSAEQIGSLLKNIKGTFDIDKNAEITLEANPGTVDLDQLRGYRQAGVNRLSLGIQSLNDQHLQLLGRIHTADQAQDSVIAARAAGFNNLSLDLMFALPDQDLSSLEEELSLLLELSPEHVSLYGLSFEKGTEFAVRLQRGELTACGESLYADQYRLLHERMNAAGFEHYEISNFARPGSRCRHNQVYWRRQTCLALGCGAHSFIADGWGERWHVPPDLSAYRRMLQNGQNACELLESFDRRTAMAETVYLALRTADGLSRTRFRRQFGSFPEELFPDAFRRQAERLKLVDDSWRLDLQGWLLYDHLISAFL